MLAYISVNSAKLPVSASLGGAKANADNYSVVPQNPLVVSDVAKGLIANDINVYGVSVVTQPAKGTLALNANGTFTYTPDSSWTATSAPTTTDTFSYRGERQSELNGCVTLTLAQQATVVENAAGITVNNIDVHVHYGDVSGDSKSWRAFRGFGRRRVSTLGGDLVGGAASGGSATPISACSLTAPVAPCVNVDAAGGFNAIVSAPGTLRVHVRGTELARHDRAAPATVTLVVPDREAVSRLVLSTAPITRRW